MLIPSERVSLCDYDRLSHRREYFCARHTVFLRIKHHIQPLANPNIKPAEALDANGIPICDKVPVWVVPMVVEICVIASATHATPFWDTI